MLFTELLRMYGLRSDNDADLDMFFGPKAYSNTPALTNLFQKKYIFRQRVQDTSMQGARRHVNPELYSDATFFPIVAALLHGARVSSVEIPFKHPESQFKIETSDDPSLTGLFKKKREAQLKGILIELSHFLQYNSQDPDTRKRSRLEIFP